MNTFGLKGTYSIIWGSVHSLIFFLLTITWYIYELYIWISENKIKEVDIQHILEDIKTISNADKQDILPVIEGIQKHMDRVKGINDKVILGIMLNILQEEAL